jgi:hypothetical protein
MNTFGFQEIPEKSNKCAVVIPTYKKSYTESEEFCIRQTFRMLGNWDIFFATDAENVDQTIKTENVKPRYSIFSKKTFESVKSYSNWLLTVEPYKRFGLYKKILICQSDALIIEDQLEHWVNKDFDYIGAPWHGLISIRPNYRSTIAFNDNEYKLFVGNGGLSMRDNKGICSVLERNAEFISEFAENEDGAFSFLGIIDPLFKLAPYHEACLFSLELRAAEIMEKTKKLPMGFHGLEKNNMNLWRLTKNSLEK